MYVFAKGLTTLFLKDTSKLFLILKHLTSFFPSLNLKLEKRSLSFCSQIAGFIFVGLDIPRKCYETLFSLKLKKSHATVLLQLGIFAHKVIDGSLVLPIQ